MTQQQSSALLLGYLTVIRTIVRGFRNRLETARMWRLRRGETSEANVARVQHMWTAVLQRWREAQASVDSGPVAPCAAASSGNGVESAVADAGTSPRAPAPDAVTNPLIERTGDGGHEEKTEREDERDFSGRSAPPPADARTRSPREVTKQKEKRKERRAARTAAYPPLFSTLMKIYRRGLLGSQFLMLLSLLFLFANPMLLWFVLIISDYSD